MPINVLVLGFSVTAATHGYADIACQNLGEDDAFSLTKIGIGGIQPEHLRYLIDSILQDTRPNFVVLEIATAGFRKSHKPPEHHQETLDYLLHNCQQRGIGAAVLDLPSKDVDQETDWVATIHRQTCHEHNIPYHLVPLRVEFLTDNVHPSPEGCIYYAEHLLSLLREADLNAPILKAFPLNKEFGSYDCVAETAESGASYTRAGYTVDTAYIYPDQPLTLQVPPGIAVVGLLFLMGPRTGKISVEVGGASVDVRGYDRHCYYQRIGAQVFAPLKGDTITITQSPEIPDTVLVKGDKDFGPRLGFVGKVLYEDYINETSA